MFVSLLLCSSVMGQTSAIDIKKVASPEIKVTLLTFLSTWNPRSQGQAYVKLVVTSDVKDLNGNIVIRKGTPVNGKTTWVANSTSLGSRGARLHIAIDETFDVNNHRVPLRADSRPKANWCNHHDKVACFDLGRDFTSKQAMWQKPLLTALRDEATKKFMVDLKAAAEAGNARAFLDEHRAEFMRLLLDLETPQETVVPTAEDFKKVAEAIQAIASGGTAPMGLNEGQVNVATMVSAALDLAPSTVKVLNWIGKQVEGKNIRAWPGTQVNAYLVDVLERQG